MNSSCTYLQSDVPTRDVVESTTQDVVESNFWHVPRCKFCFDACKRLSPNDLSYAPRSMPIRTLAAWFKFEVRIYRSESGR